MRGSLRVALQATLLSTTVLTPAFAADEQPVTTLDTTTVYATKSKHSTFDVPAMVNTIDADAPGNANAGMLQDLIDHQVGVEVTGGPRSNGQVVNIRGYSDEAIITLIDGRRQQFPTGHDGRQFVDPSLLKTVEIVRGSSSAIYGGGGIGGIVAFETKDAADLLEPGKDFGASSSLLFRSGNNTFSPNVTAYGLVGNLDLVGSLTYKRAGDIEQGDSSELEAKDRIYNAILKGAYTFQDFHTTSLSATIFNNDGKEPNNPASTGDVIAKEVSDYQFSFKYEYENPEEDLINPKLHLYYNLTKTDERDLVGANAGRVRSRDFNTLGFTADNQSRVSFGNNHNHTFSYGIEAYRDTLEPSSSTGTFDGVPDAQSDTFGIYIQDEIDIRTSAGQFLIIPAVRYDHFSSEDNSGNDQSEGAFSPKIAVTYKPVPEFMLFSSVARAFRAPALIETYATGLHFPGGGPIPNNFFVPNPDLKPETVDTVEIGAGIDLNNIIAKNDALLVKGSVYQSWGKDFISLDVDVFGGTTENTNVPDAKLFGWELEGSYAYGPWNVRTGLSYVEAENDDTGEYLANSTPVTFVSDLSYTAKSIDSVIGWRMKASDDADKVEDGGTETDGYAVHDVYYRYAPQEGQFQNLTFDFSIENLFDTEYVRKGAVVLEEGVSFNARVGYKW